MTGNPDTQRLSPPGEDRRARSKSCPSYEEQQLIPLSSRRMRLGERRMKRMRPRKLNCRIAKSAVRIDREGSSKSYPVREVKMAKAKILQGWPTEWRKQGVVC